MLADSKTAEENQHPFIFPSLVQPTGSAIFHLSIRISVKAVEVSSGFLLHETNIQIYIKLN